MRSEAPKMSAGMRKFPSISGQDKARSSIMEISFRFGVK